MIAFAIELLEAFADRRETIVPSFVLCVYAIKTFIMHGHQELAMIMRCSQDNTVLLEATGRWRTERPPEVIEQMWGQEP
jgi:hypothetical protein